MLRTVRFPACGQAGCCPVTGSIHFDGAGTRWRSPGCLQPSVRCKSSAFPAAAAHACPEPISVPAAARCRLSVVDSDDDSDDDSEVAAAGDPHVAGLLTRMHARVRISRTRMSCTTARRRPQMEGHGRRDRLSEWLLAALMA